MKKVLSLLLSIVMLFSITAGLDFSALANTVYDGYFAGEELLYCFTAEHSNVYSFSINGLGDPYDNDYDSQVDIYNSNNECVRSFLPQYGQTASLYLQSDETVTVKYNDLNCRDYDIELVVSEKDNQYIPGFDGMDVQAEQNVFFEANGEDDLSCYELFFIPESSGNYRFTQPMSDSYFSVTDTENSVTEYCEEGSTGRVVYNMESGKAYKISFSFYGNDSELYIESAEGQCNSDIASIEFLPSSQYSIMEETRGRWETDTDGNEFYYYYPFGSYADWREGDSFKVTYKNSETDIFAYDSDSWSFLNDEGKKIDFYFYSNQYEKHWTLGSENEAIISVCDENYNTVAATSIYVTITENPVKSISYTPGKNIVYIENTGGEWAERWNEDTQDYESYYYYYEPGNEFGDVLIIEYKDGTVKEYFADEDGAFCTGDGEYLENQNGELYYSSNQYFEPWTLGGDNYMTVTYCGRECRVPVTVKKRTIVDCGTIAVNETKNVTVEEIGNEYRFSFTPEEDGRYIFCSNGADGWKSVLGYIMDEDGNELSLGDGNYKENGFSASYDLTAGKTYKLCCRMSSVYSTGSFNVSLKIQRNIASAKYTPSKTKYVENTNGRFIDGYFKYDIGIKNGDKLTLIYDNNTEESLTYYDEYVDGYGWKYGWYSDATDESMDISVSTTNNFSKNPWVAGADNSINIVIKSYDGDVLANASSPVELVGVSNLEFHKCSNEPKIFYEGAGSAEIDENGNQYTYYNTGWLIDDFIDYAVITLDDGSTQTLYLQPYASEGEFTNEDYSIEIYLGNIKRTDNQETEHWGIGRHTVTYAYGEYGFEIPVEVVENPVDSVDFIPAESYVLFKSEDDYEEGYGYYYDAPYFYEGDKIVINFKDGTKAEYIAESRYGDFYNSDNENYLYAYALGFRFEGTGDTTFTVCIDDYGKEVEVPVSIIEYNVESISASPSVILVENNGGHYNYNWETGEYGSTYYYDTYSMPFDLTVNFNDGTSKTYKNLYDGAYVEGGYAVHAEGDSFENWGAGKDCKITVFYFGFNTTVTYQMVENPVVDFSVSQREVTDIDPHKLKTGASSVCPDCMIDYIDFVITYADGTQDKVSGSELSGEKHAGGLSDDVAESWTFDRTLHSNKGKYLLDVTYSHEESESHYYCETGDIMSFEIGGITKSLTLNLGETEHIHKYTAEVVEPTCTDMGYTVYTCQCGDTFVEKDINAKGHTIVTDSAVLPTCTQTGLTEGSHCSVCGTVITAQNVVSATGHSYDNGKVTEAATCTETGVKTYTCTICGETKTEAIAKAAHTYKNYVTKATTSKNGSIVNKCSVCGTVKSKSTIYYPKTVTLSATSYTYDGKVKKPSVKVVDSNGKTISSSNYTVTYSSGRKNVGKYNVKITFKGNYSGTITKSFTIKPKNTSISGVTAKSKGFTAKWKKYTTQTTGYQIQYSTSSKFTNAKTVTVSKNSTTSKTISKLSAKKKYYVRIRTYKTVNGTKYYSSWSKAKTVTTKK